MSICKSVIMLFLQKILKSKMKFVMYFTGLSIASLLVTYYAFGADTPKNPVSRRHPGAKMENINELMDITQHPKDVARQRHVENELVKNISINVKKQKNDQKRRMKPQKFQALSNMKISENRMHRLVHLDLKGAPPRLEYLKKFLPFIKKLGATGVLIEYEDMFPYSGPIFELSAHNAYSREEIKELLKLCRDLNFEIIPLIQTFGHLEFMLKLESFSSLREVPDYPQVVCPSNNSTLKYIRMMIDQVMDLHQGLNFFHIGCDEVYNLGVCDKCQHRMMKNKWSKSQLFLDHVKSIGSYLKKSYDVQPIMWDDEFRKFSEEDLYNSGIGDVAELMIWKYVPDVSEEITPQLWNKYINVFNTIWVASSFKGATGSDQTFTDPIYHMENHKSWIKIIEENKNKIFIRGIAMTGWQRFDHFAVLCELLPAAMPSLAANLLLLQASKSDVGELLQCDSSFQISLTDMDLSAYSTECNFPGSFIFKGILNLYFWKKEFETFLQNDHLKGWLNKYNINHKFSSPAHVSIGIKELPELHRNLHNIKNLLEKGLRNVYDEFTVSEFLETYITPLEKKVDTMRANADMLKKIKIWPRRPLAITKNTDDL